MFMEDIIVELKNQIDVMKKEYEKLEKKLLYKKWKTHN